LEQAPFYLKSLEALEAFRVDTNTDTSQNLKVAWTEARIPFSVPVELAGYKPFRSATQVHDSLFLRIMHFQKGELKAFIITTDLLIFPPALATKIKAKASKAGVALGHFYFSASHTHHGIGQWLQGKAGFFVGGSYSEEMIDRLSDEVLAALKRLSKLAMAASGVGQFEVAVPGLVRNRLVGDNGEKDSLFKFLIIKRKDGEVGVVCSYSAHPTCISKNIDEVSNDYPGELIAQLKKSGKVNFACFLAGPMGSHGPVEKVRDFELTQTIGKVLSDSVLSRIEAVRSEGTVNIALGADEFSFKFGQPGIRATQHLQIRNWFFKWAFGDQQPALSFFRLGNVLMVGTPCDFSGELSVPLYRYAEAHQFKLWTTSFNGAYFGYITPDQYFHSVKKAEIREMRWTGPYSGTYLSNMIKQVIKNEASR